MLELLDQLPLTELNLKTSKGGDVSQLQEFLGKYLVCIDLKSPKDQWMGSDQQMYAAEWTASIDSTQFYIDLAQSIALTETINLPNLGLKGNHSLTINDCTWLILQHHEYGLCAILQRNFSCEAAYFAGLKLLVLRKEGRLQHQFFVLLISNFIKNIKEVNSYFSSTPVFGGINILFPSPFHAINFGHLALYCLQKEGIRLKTTAFAKAENVWFDPCNAFPSVVSKVANFKGGQSFLELQQGTRIYMIKPAHRYLAKEDELNRNLDMVLLAASRCSTAKEQDLKTCRLWIGLTSGRRSLLNESEVVKILILSIAQTWGIQEVVIDGWTSSSLKDDTGVVPIAYQNHASEFEALKTQIYQISPSLKVSSLVGMNYEQKVREANNCNFFFSNALTASFIPCRVCALPGIVHTSNKARNSLQMHIYRKASLIPQELIRDGVGSNISDVFATPYEILAPLFDPWLKTYLQRQVVPLGRIHQIC